MIRNQMGFKVVMALVKFRRAVRKLPTLEIDNKILKIAEREYGWQFRASKIQKNNFSRENIRNLRGGVGDALGGSARN